ncbi:MAG: hypothetical protein ABEK29_05880, partial [Bradymonadaceae bacterium]
MTRSGSPAPANGPGAGICPSSPPTRSCTTTRPVGPCIDHGVTIHEAGTHTAPNDQHALKSPADFEKLFQDAPLAVERTREIADRCTFSLDEIHYRYPSQDLPEGMTSADRLRELCLEGARWRYGAAASRGGKDAARSNDGKDEGVAKGGATPSLALLWWDAVPGVPGRQGC